MEQPAVHRDGADRRRAAGRAARRRPAAGVRGTADCGGRRRRARRPPSTRRHPSRPQAIERVRHGHRHQGRRLRPRAPGRLGARGHRDYQLRHLPRHTAVRGPRTAARRRSGRARRSVLRRGDALRDAGRTPAVFGEDAGGDRAVGAARHAAGVDRLAGDLRGRSHPAPGAVEEVGGSISDGGCAGRGPAGRAAAGGGRSRGRSADDAASGRPAVPSPEARSGDGLPGAQPGRRVGQLADRARIARRALEPQVGPLRQYGARFGGRRRGPGR